MRHQDMQATKLVDYALRMATGAVVRRLGYLLELYAIAPESQLARLRDALTETYASARSHAARGGDALAPLAASTQHHAAGTRISPGELNDPTAQPLTSRQQALPRKADAAFPRACLNATIALPGSSRRSRNRPSGDARFKGGTALKRCYFRRLSFFRGSRLYSDRARERLTN